MVSTNFLCFSWDWARSSLIDARTLDTESLLEVEEKPVSTYLVVLDLQGLIHLPHFSEYWQVLDEQVLFFRVGLDFCPCLAPNTLTDFLRTTPPPRRFTPLFIYTCP